MEGNKRKDTDLKYKDICIPHEKENNGKGLYHQSAIGHEAVFSFLPP